jgi:hypothetical protein
MTLPAQAKPRNKRLSFYKHVIDNLADTYSVIALGAIDIFSGWMTPTAFDALEAWIELDVESFSGGLDSKMSVIFRVYVRRSKDDVDYMAKRSDEIIESIMSLMNMAEGAVIPIYDFADAESPVQIGADDNLGFIVDHVPERDRFDQSNRNLSKYSIHYTLWLWTEGVLP